MNLACPYCGVEIGNGLPTNYTPVRYGIKATVQEFRMIDLSKVSEPRTVPVRVIQSCQGDDCKAAASRVEPRAPQRSER